MPPAVLTTKPRSGQSPSPTAKPRLPVASSSASEHRTRAVSISQGGDATSRQPHQEQQAGNAQRGREQEEIPVSERIDEEPRRAHQQFSRQRVERRQHGVLSGRVL